MLTRSECRRCGEFAPQHCRDMIAARANRVVVIVAYRHVSSWPKIGRSSVAMYREPRSPAASCPINWKNCGRTKPPSRPASTPRPSSPKALIYVGDSEGTLHAVKLADGKPVWTKKFDDSGGFMAGARG